MDVCIFAKEESTDPNYYIKKYFLNERSIKSGETDPKFHKEIRERSIPVTGRKRLSINF